MAAQAVKAGQPSGFHNTAPLTPAMLPVIANDASPQQDEGVQAYIPMPSDAQTSSHSARSRDRYWSDPGSWNSRPEA